jgi:hypothetical protein
LDWSRSGKKDGLSVNSLRNFGDERLGIDGLRTYRSNVGLENTFFGIRLLEEIGNSFNRKGFDVDDKFFVLFEPGEDFTRFEPIGILRSAKASDNELQGFLKIIPRFHILDPILQKLIIKAVIG